MKNYFKFQYPLLCLVLYASLMILPGLADSVLQVDEGADTFVSTTILKYAVPKHSDETNATMLFADVYQGLFVYRTWFPYYLQAGFMEFLGPSTFSARLPFALCGILSIVALYYFALRMTGSKSVAFFSGFLLASSVPALLFFRTARYVGLPILLTPFLLYLYLRLYEKKPWNPFAFTLICLVYFQTMYVEFAGLLIGILVHLYLNRKDILAENMNRVYFSAFVVAALTIPWQIAIIPVFTKITEFYQNASILVQSNAMSPITRLAGYLFQTNNNLFPFILIPLFWLQPLRTHRKILQLPLLCLVGIYLTATVHSIPMQQYVAGGIPLLCFIMGIILAKGLNRKPVLQTLMAVTLILSNLFHIGPLWIFKPVVDKARGLFSGPRLESAHDTFMREISLQSHLYDYGYEIAHRYQGPLDAIVHFFATHGTPGDTCYIDNEAESLTFYTGMKMIDDSALSPASPPKWIVLRGARWLPENEMQKKDPALQQIISSHPYEKIILSASKMRNNNSYDIQIRKHKSPENSDRIRIYKRID
ncbi:MAG: hypothetical protein COV66_01465 [Nitrospinae bacterium CG11_big_fil_rev_8_21_14_0_20_45_15]|nr:MAG: hypothetical protein COV66_01465 [Nitrospinae bacterium CG11_big_fil_rev_8_21_14_0_20_45_15]